MFLKILILKKVSVFNVRSRGFYPKNICRNKYLSSKFWETPNMDIIYSFFNFWFFLQIILFLINIFYIRIYLIYIWGSMHLIKKYFSCKIFKGSKHYEWMNKKKRILFLWKNKNKNICDNFRLGEILVLLSSFAYTPSAMFDIKVFTY